MSDLGHAVRAEVDARTPDHVPAFEVLEARKRRRDWRLRLGAGAAAVLTALAVVVIAVPRITAPDNDTRDTLTAGGARSEEVPRTVAVECAADGPRLPNGSRVAAQPDGVHYTFRNTTGIELRIMFGLSGTTLAPNATQSFTGFRAVAPDSTSTVSCSDDIETSQAHAIPVRIEDPDGVYVPVPRCEGPTTIRDFVSGSGRDGDPVALTLEDHTRAELVGYPEADVRTVYTGDSLIQWSRSGAGWVPGEVTVCERG